MIKKDCLVYLTYNSTKVMIIHLIVGLTKKTVINEWIFSKTVKVELDSIYTSTSYLKNATDPYIGFC